MRWKRLLALALGLALLCACTPRQAGPTPTPTPEPTPTPPDRTDFFRAQVAVLRDPSGLGAAKLMEESGTGEDPDRPYAFSVYDEPASAAEALSKGEADIALLPANLASTLYHQTGGGVQLLSLCAYGMLYVLENGYTVYSVNDLRGRTLHACGQGTDPEFILNYLLTENGLVPGEDVTLQWHADAGEVVGLMTTGEAELCMLPVPAAAEALQGSDQLRAALDLTLEWENVGADGMLTMGCVVARREFVSAHPEMVEGFLKDYEASIVYMTDPDELAPAAALAEKQGIVSSAAVAERALPEANLCFVTGDEMMNDIQGYYQVLYASDPASIGGSIPDGAFYYGQG